MNGRSKERGGSEKTRIVYPSFRVGIQPERRLLFYNSTWNIKCSLTMLVRSKKSNSMICWRGWRQRQSTNRGPCVIHRDTDGGRISVSILHYWQAWIMEEGIGKNSGEWRKEGIDVTVSSSCTSSAPSRRDYQPGVCKLARDIWYRYRLINFRSRAVLSSVESKLFGCFRTTSSATAERKKSGWNWFLETTRSAYRFSEFGLWSVSNTRGKEFRPLLAGNVTRRRIRPITWICIE